MNKILEVGSRVFSVGYEYVRVELGSGGMRKVLGNGRGELETSKDFFVSGLGLVVSSVVVVGVGLRYLSFKMGEAGDSASREVFYDRYRQVVGVIFGFCAMGVFIGILMLLLSALFFLYWSLANCF